MATTPALVPENIDMETGANFTFQSSIVFKGHNETFAAQAYKKHRGDMLQVHEGTRVPHIRENLDTCGLPPNLCVALDFPSLHHTPCVHSSHPSPTTLIIRIRLQIPATSKCAIISDRAPDAVDERLRRQHAHENLLKTNKASFHRKKNFMVEHAEQVQALRPLLADCHPVERTTTFQSIIQQPPDPYHYDIGTIRPRTTGYSVGHTRTLTGGPIVWGVGGGGGGDR